MSTFHIAQALLKETVFNLILDYILGLSLNYLYS